MDKKMFKGEEQWKKSHGEPAVRSRGLHGGAYACIVSQRRGSVGGISWPQGFKASGGAKQCGCRCC